MRISGHAGITVGTDGQTQRKLGVLHLDGFSAALLVGAGAVAAGAVIVAARAPGRKGVARSEPGTIGATR
jgi:hypothetical protein